MHPLLFASLQTPQSRKHCRYREFAARYSIRANLHEVTTWNRLPALLGKALCKTSHLGCCHGKVGTHGFGEEKGRDEQASSRLVLQKKCEMDEGFQVTLKSVGLHFLKIGDRQH